MGAHKDILPLTLVLVDQRWKWQESLAEIKGNPGYSFTRHRRSLSFKHLLSRCDYKIWELCRAYSQLSSIHEWLGYLESSFDLFVQSEESVPRVCEVSGDHTDQGRANYRAKLNLPWHLSDRLTDWSKLPSRDCLWKEDLCHSAQKGKTRLFSLTAFIYLWSTNRS